MAANRHCDPVFRALPCHMLHQPQQRRGVGPIQATYIGVGPVRRKEILTKSLVPMLKKSASAANSPASMAAEGHLDHHADGHVLAGRTYPLHGAGSWHAPTRL